MKDSGRGQAVTCSICGAMYTNTARTMLQREKAYDEHKKSERHRAVIARYIEQ